MNHIYHVTPLAWNAPQKNNKKTPNNLRFFLLCSWITSSSTSSMQSFYEKRDGEKHCHLCRVFGYSSSVYHPPSTPHALASLPSSIPLNNTILARLQSHHFSIIHWLVPLLRQGAVKELKQLNLLSYTAVNNAIRVTDCQEGAELRLLWMCVRVCLRVCAFGCAFAHTPDARCMTHLKFTSPLMPTVLPLRQAEIHLTCRWVTLGDQASSCRSFICTSGEITTY